MAQVIALQHFYKVEFFQFGKWFVDEYTCIVNQYIYPAIKVRRDELLQIIMVIIYQVESETI